MSQLTKSFSNQNLIVFVAALGVGAYAVYNVGDLQTVIYAVCGAYVLRLMVQNPEVVAKMQDQLSGLNRAKPVATTPAAPRTAAAPVVHPELVPAIPREPVYPGSMQPRLDMNILQQTGYQPLHQSAHPTTSAHHSHPHHDHYDHNSPTTPVPSYPQFQFNVTSATTRAPSRSATQQYQGNFPHPMSNPFSGYTQQQQQPPATGSMHSEDHLTPRASFNDPRLSIVSTFSAFPEPTRNPYTSYSHYDAGTIGGERVNGARGEEYPANFNVSERIAAPPQRPDSQHSHRSETLPATMNSSSFTVPLPPSRSASANLETAIKISEYVPKRAHRKPTVAARVGTVGAPGGGIAPPPPHLSRTPSPSTSNKSPAEPVKFFGSSESPLVTSPQCGYESDSSHASSSNGSNDRASSNNGHARTESSASLGLPTYEKHATTIFTLVPKRPGYVPQIQAILKAARQSWLGLPGTVSHEVGQDNSTGSVVVVETYESTESMEDFEKSTERNSILERMRTFIDESKTTIVRLPGSSAATRLVR